MAPVDLAIVEHVTLLAQARDQGPGGFEDGRLAQPGLDEQPQGVSAPLPARQCLEQPSRRATLRPQLCPATTVVAGDCAWGAQSRTWGSSSSCSASQNSGLQGSSLLRRARSLLSISR